MSFETAYNAMIQREGGYRLESVEGDRGGQTYAGIARRMSPDWIGWADIDAGRTPETALVRNFYRTQYWTPIAGDQLPEAIADTLFDFAVNAGVKTAVKLAQLVVGAAADGSVGPKTIAALTDANPAEFRAHYTLVKIKRYTDIVRRDRSQNKFLLGWITRALEAT